MSQYQILVLISQLFALRQSLVEADVIPPWTTLLDSVTTAAALAEKYARLIDRYDR
jgi:hypothetical protein